MEIPIFFLLGENYTDKIYSYESTSTYFFVYGCAEANAEKYRRFNCEPFYGVSKVIIEFIRFRGVKFFGQYLREVWESDR